MQHGKVPNACNGQCSDDDAGERAETYVEGDYLLDNILGNSHEESSANSSAIYPAKFRPSPIISRANPERR